MAFLNQTISKNELGLNLQLNGKLVKAWIVFSIHCVYMLYSNSNNSINYEDEAPRRWLDISVITDYIYMTLLDIRHSYSTLYKSSQSPQQPYEAGIIFKL